MPIVSAAWLHCTMAFHPDAAQNELLEQSAQPHCAVLGLGGPGSGKTSALIAAIVRRVRNGSSLDRLVVLTWSRPAAQELRSRIIEELGVSQLAPVITTVPGWCLALLGRFGAVDPDGNLPRVLTGPEQQVQVRELVEELGPSIWPASVRPALATMAFSQELRTGLARARQNGLDPDDLIELGERLGRPEWAGMGAFFEKYLDVLDAQNAMDYAELVHRCRLMLLDPSVATGLGKQLDGVYCDEFAELDRSQIGLLAQVRALGVPTTVVADPYTSVFGFRGADRRAVPDFPDRFATPGLPEPVRVDLMNLKRGTPVLRTAVGRLLTHVPMAVAVSPARRLQSGTQDSRGESSHRAEAGDIGLLTYDSRIAEIDGVADDLRRARLRGVHWADQAVICRAGKGELGTIARGLANRGIPIDVAGDEIALGEQACVHTLLSAMQLALALARGDEPDLQVLDELLVSPLTGLDPSGMRRLTRALPPRASDDHRDRAVVVHELVIETARQCVDQTATDQPSPMPDNWPSDPEAASARQLATLLGKAARTIKSGGGAADVLWELWDGTDWPQRLRREAMSDRTTGSADRDLDAINALFDVAARHIDLRGAKGVAALVNEVVAQQIPGDQARESDPRGAGVQVLTAHRAKGHRWTRVVIMGAVEGEWPGMGRGPGLLAVEQLDPDAPGMGPEPGAWIRQERRAFALAASRADGELVITATLGTGDDRAEPSRFAAELGATERAMHRGPVHPATLDGLVAELRGATLNPENSPALRASAAQQLGELALLTDERGRRLVRSADPLNWWGVGGNSGAAAGLGDAELIRLSVTGLQALMECPRKWFLETQAGGRTGGGLAAGLGSFIHLLAEQSVTEGLEEQRMHELLDEAWPGLDVSGGWRSDIELADAHLMVTRLMSWTSGRAHREVLGVEVPVRHRLVVDDQAVELVGSIDRLERDPGSGRIWVIDFKTGKYAPTMAQASTNLQLAAYQLAVADGACRDLTGDSPLIGGAELVHVRIPQGLRAPLSPKSVEQPSLHDHPYPPDDAITGSWLARLDRHGPSMVADALRDAVNYLRSNDFVAIQGPPCTYCAFRQNCPVWNREVATQ